MTTELHTRPQYMITALTLATLCSTLLTLNGCSAYTQSTSGSDYLARHNTPQPSTTAEMTAHNQQWLSADDAIREAARVEPTLRFPARIGVAYIGEYSRLEIVPGSQAVAWQELGERLSPTLGELVPVNPILATVAMASVRQQPGSAYGGRLSGTVTQLRMAAARQHLDAVLVYETSAHTRQQKNGLSLANLSVVGAWVVPSRELNTQASGTATLIDVLSGYHYGTVTATANERSLSTAIHSHDRGEAQEQRLRDAAAMSLIKELEGMFKMLWTESQQRTGRSPQPAS